MRQETDEVFILTVSFSSHENSVRHLSILQMRKPRLKEFRIWLQIIYLITGTTRVFIQSFLLPQLPVCLHLPLLLPYLTVSRPWRGEGVALRKCLHRGSKHMTCAVSPVRTHVPHVSNVESMDLTSHTGSGSPRGPGQ